MIFVTDLTLTTSFSSVILLEGDTITLSCTPSIIEIVVLWTYNGKNITQRENILFTPPGLSHVLNITNVGITNSGIYNCHAAVHDGKPVDQNITVSVIGGTVYISGAYELPMAAKEHETYTACQVPSQSKSISN